MKTLHAWRWPIFLGATAIVYAPVLPALANSPQGLQVPALWAALLYLLIAGPVALALFDGLVRRIVPPRPMPRAFAALVLVPFGLCALLLVPLMPALVLRLEPSHSLLLGQGLLLTRYLDECLGTAMSSLTLFAFAVVLVGLCLLPRKPARPGRFRGA